VSDPAALSRLAELGVTPEAAAALTLLPMAAVAWADGGVSLTERGAVVQAAERAGVAPGTPASQLLEGWLREPPSPGLLEAWKAYAHALAGQATAEERGRFAETVLGRARAVADAEGGFFGLGRRISSAEQALLDELHRALQPG
jgi:tellurite resistance protein